MAGNNALRAVPMNRTGRGKKKDYRWYYNIFSYTDGLMSALVREHCLRYPEMFRAAIIGNNLVTVHDAGLVKCDVRRRNVHQDTDGRSVRLRTRGLWSKVPKNTASGNNTLWFYRLDVKTVRMYRRAHVQSASSHCVFRRPRASPSSPTRHHYTRIRHRSPATNNKSTKNIYTLLFSLDPILIIFE